MTQLYAVLHTSPTSECERVGHTRQWLMDNLSGLTETYLNQEGQTQIRIKTGVTLNLDLQGTGADRVLHVSVVGMNVSQNQKNAAQAWCDSNFGVGKIGID